MHVCFLYIFLVMEKYSHWQHLSSFMGLGACAAKGREKRIHMKAPREAQALSKLEFSQDSKCQAHLLIPRAHNCEYAQRVKTQFYSLATKATTPSAHQLWALGHCDGL